MPFIIEHATKQLWRGWGDYGFVWTDVQADAIQYARRADADRVASEDIDAGFIREIMLVDGAPVRVGLGNRQAVSSSFSKEGEKTLSTIVCIESPFAGRGTNWFARKIDAYLNLIYARQCLRDSLTRGESPFASHLLYTQRGVLRDGVKEERAHGINAGLRFQDVASFVAVYVDREITPGMSMAIKRAEDNGKRIVFRSLFDDIIEERSKRRDLSEEAYKHDGSWSL